MNKLHSYDEISHKLHSIGYNAEMLNINDRNALKLSLPAVDDAPTFWIALRNSDYFVCLPGPRFYRIGNTVSICDLCLVLLDRIRSGYWSSILDESIKEAYALTKVDRSEWIRQERAEWFLKIKSSGWSLLEKEDENKAWEKVSETFDFPGGRIKEPAPSVIWDISQLFIQPAGERQIQEVELHAKVYEAFLRCLDVGERIFALDWNHNCFMFSPQLMANPRDLNSWAISLIPESSHRFFFAPDLRFGIIGTLDGTICFFGAELLGVILKDKPELLISVVRRNEI